MKWLLSKIKNPRKAIGVKIFSNPTIQLGDIVSLKYKQNNIERKTNLSLILPFTDIDRFMTLLGYKLLKYENQLFRILFSVLRASTEYAMESSCIFGVYMILLNTSIL